ncbi:hypothetical protein [Bradyrhizobium sp. 192]|uniref:hypothetical protein n=1 Tax=Bradyrhizobium sp. 192 TaxID=2782660 RepID=UPI001FFFD620|nr:hypothetical protein [Bradyrhizobium sp. 192]UPJ55415.1 hypothetical protein IVB24_22420 [Bradyrhizobium sp. 192]
MAPTLRQGDRLGAATRHRQAFLRNHKTCAFCGGGAPSSTIEHCPPRALFQHRQWPEGFEFPACQACNNGSSNHDLVIAMLARMDPFENKGDLDGAAVGLMKAAHRQHPELLQNMMMRANQARRANRELGLRPRPGQTHQDTLLANVTDEMRKAVEVFAGKLAKAIYYMHADTIFPADGSLVMCWCTNTDLLRHGKFQLFEVVKDVPGEAPHLIRSGKFLNDQFEYKFSLSDEQHLFALQARFGNAFGLIVFGATTPGLLEQHIRRLECTIAREDEGPFRILQSTVLPLGLRPVGMHLESDNSP